MPAAVGGQELRAADLAALGSRVIRAERACNQANGFTAADDTLPERLFAPLSGHPLPPLERTRLAEEVGRYYRIRGFDPDGRVPTGDAGEKN